jgi:hypothetical protein
MKKAIILALEDRKNAKKACFMLVTWALLMIFQ